MTWVQLDDHWDDHPKFGMVSAAAALLWVRALTYAKRQLTDGYVPTGLLCRLAWQTDGKVDGKLPSAPHVLPSPIELAEELVRALPPGYQFGLWEHAPGGGYLIHDFLEWNDSRVIVLGKRKDLAVKRAKAGKAGADSRWKEPGKSMASCHTGCHDHDHGPSPSPSPDPDPDLQPAPVPVASRRGQATFGAINTVELGTQPEGSKTKSKPEAVPKAEPTSVEVVFAHWASTFAPKAKLDDKRRKVLTAALALGYTVEDLCRVVDGTLHNSHRMGDNDRGKRFVDISLLYRDADHIDDAIATAEKALEVIEPDRDDFDDGRPDPDDPDPPGEPLEITPELIQGLLDVVNGVSNG